MKNTWLTVVSIVLIAVCGVLSILAIPHYINEENSRAVWFILAIWVLVAALVAIIRSRGKFLKK